MPAASRPHALSPPPHPVPTCFAGVTTPAIDLLVAMSEMCRAAQSGERVSRRACASECGRLDHSHFAPRPVPGTLSPLLSPSRSVATARVHLLSLSHRGPLASSRYLALRYCHSGLFPPRRHRSFLPLSPPHSNVPTVYPPSIRASAHSPSLFPPARPIALDVRTNRER